MFRDAIDRHILRRRVKHTDFTIISSNCWGSRVYQDLGVSYNTPFAGLFFFAPCFIRLLGDLESYLSGTLEFKKESKYAAHLGNGKGHPYPIGVLKNDVEIHFQHYKSLKEAREKWVKRLKRVNMEKLYISFTDRDLCDESHLVTFDKLSYGKKICFTAKQYPHIPSTFQLPEYKNDPHVGDIYTQHYVYKRHFDVADWLNGGDGKNKSFQQHLYCLLS